MSFLVNAVSITLASVFLTLGFRRDGCWRGFARTAGVFTCLLIAAFVAQFLTPHIGRPYGITNRIFVTILILWLSSIAIQLRSDRHP